MSKKGIDGQTLLNYAVRVEEEGYRFYLHLAKAVSDKKLMDLFHWFAEDELRHEHTFKKLAEETAVLLDGSGKAADPLLAGFVEDMDKFESEQLKKAMAGELDREALLGVAIQLEKDSILFYSSLKPHLNRESREIFESIIDEELRHLSRLFAIRQGEIADGADAAEEI